MKYLFATVLLMSLTYGGRELLAALAMASPLLMLIALAGAMMWRKR